MSSLVGKGNSATVHEKKQVRLFYLLVYITRGSEKLGGFQKKEKNLPDSIFSMVKDLTVKKLQFQNIA